MSSGGPDPTAALGGLQEIPLPPPPAWTPQTPGWWIVAALLVALLAWGVARFVRHRRANRYRRDALRELAEIERACADPARRRAALARLAALPKRCALAIAPRAEVAPLTGDAWLAWLDARCPRAGLAGEPGRTLVRMTYGAPDLAVDDDALRALLRATHDWIAGHRAGA